jgi:hypothetical protein
VPIALKPARTMSAGRGVCSRAAESGGELVGVVQCHREGNRELVVGCERCLVAPVEVTDAERARADRRDAGRPPACAPPCRRPAPPTAPGSLLGHARAPNLVMQVRPRQHLSHRGSGRRTGLDHFKLYKARLFARRRWAYGEPPPPSSGCETSQCEVSTRQFTNPLCPPPLRSLGIRRCGHERVRADGPVVRKAGLSN